MSRTQVTDPTAAFPAAKPYSLGVDQSQTSTQERIGSPEDQTSPPRHTHTNVLRKESELILVDDDLLTSVVESHLADVFRAAVQNDGKDDNEEEQALGLTSVLSEKRIGHTPESSNAVTPKKPNLAIPGLAHIPNVRLTIDMITSNRESMINGLEPAVSVTTQQMCEYTLKNQGKSAQSTFITFGLFALQNKFEILSASPIETMIRRKSRYHPVKDLLAFCCLGAKIAQVYQFRQHSNKPNVVVLTMIEGDKDEFSNFSMLLKRKLWDINEIFLNEEESLKLFLSVQKNTVIKELREELRDHQNKRRSDEYIMEVCLERVIETVDALVDAYAVRTTSIIASAPYQTVSIAKFVFEESGIFNIFRKICKSQEETFQQKKKKILASMWYEQVFEKLKIDEKLRLCDKNIPEKDRPFPYKPAIEELQRLNTMTLPSEKINCVLSYFQSLKDSYRDYHNEQIEIEDMDYILPLFVFTVIYAKVDNFYANMKILEFYNKRNDRLKGDMQVLTNLLLSAEFVSNQWTF